MDVAWDRGKAIMVILACNHEGNVMGLLYDNLNYALILATKLLAIQKAYMVVDNFLG